MCMCPWTVTKIFSKENIKHNIKKTKKQKQLQYYMYVIKMRMPLSPTEILILLKVCTPIP